MEVGFRPASVSLRGLHFPIHCLPAGDSNSPVAACMKAAQACPRVAGVSVMRARHKLSNEQAGQPLMTEL